MPAPSDRKYLETHEWHKAEGGVVTLGLTRFAVDELTDVTFVQLPTVGSKVKAGDSIGEIESVKATSDIYCGVSGEVTAVNDAVAADPGGVNRDPYGAGWLVKIRVEGKGEIEKMMDAGAYNARYPTDAST